MSYMDPNSGVILPRRPRGCDQLHATQRLTTPGNQLFRDGSQSVDEVKSALAADPDRTFAQVARDLGYLNQERVRQIAKGLGLESGRAKRARLEEAPKEPPCQQPKISHNS